MRPQLKVASAETDGSHQPAAEPMALDVRNLHKVFLTRAGRVVEAVGGISLSVSHGEVVAIIGPSGCGKSSVLRILSNLDTEYQGEIVWGLDDAAGHEKRLRSATVFQVDSTMPWLTVEDNLRIGCSGLRLTTAELDARLERYLSLIGMAEFRTAYPHELSGGMRQRVAIARALATEPHLLLMDEPLASLDAQTRIVMQQELLNIWRQTQSTVIYITHDIAEALTLADRVVVMTARPGRIKAVREVPFEGERNALEMRHLSKFSELELQLWRMIADEVGQNLGAIAR